MDVRRCATDVRRFPIDFRWFSSVFYEFEVLPLMFRDFPWFSIDFHGFASMCNRFSMISSGFSLIPVYFRISSMIVHACSLIFLMNLHVFFVRLCSIDFHRFQSMCHRFPLISCGFSFVFVDVRRFSMYVPHFHRISMNFNGFYPPPCRQAPVECL